MMPETQCMIPDRFVADEKFFSWGINMKLFDQNSHQFGEIKEVKLTLGKQYKLYLNGKVYAYAKQIILAIGTHLQIYDEHETKIGEYHHQNLKSFFSVHDKYEVMDQFGKVIARTKCFDFFKAEVTILDLADNKVGEMKKKKFFSIGGDKWDIDLRTPIDKRLLIFIPAFVTDMRRDVAAVELAC